MSEYYQERKHVSYFYNDLRGQFLDESIVCQDTIKSSGERQGKGEKEQQNCAKLRLHGEVHGLSMQNLSLHLHDTGRLVPSTNTFRDR